MTLIEANGREQRTPAGSPNLMVYHSALRAYLTVLGLVAAVEWLPVLAGMALHHHSLPYWSPLFDPAGRFQDWTNFVPRTRHFGQPGMLANPAFGLPYPYPVPSMAVFLVLEFFFRDTVHAYLACAAGIFLVGALAFSWVLARRRAGSLAQASLWATVVLGLPALFLIDRGNIEVFLWLLLLAGLAAFLSKRPYAAAALFGLAASMKIYPALLLLLFVPQRHWKALVLGLGVAVGATLCMLQVIGPTIPAALHDLAWGARVLRDSQVLPLAEFALRFDHSLLGLAKQVLLSR